MAPLVQEFNKHCDFETKVCVTAQHRDMLDQVLKIFDIQPDYDLNIMTKGQDLFDISVKVLEGLKNILKDFQPDLLLVHGDTTTSSMSALAGFYSKIKVAHVEAGLRTGSKFSPFPEEMNRQITGRLADFHFAPTQLNVDNLLKEGVNRANIILCGNTVIDALLFTIKKIEGDIELKKSLNSQFLSYGIDLNKKNILITCHRRESFGEGIVNLCDALLSCASKYKDVNFIYPVHPNPNIKDIVYNRLDSIKNIYLLPPLDYIPFVFLLNKSYFILSDSGGIQEEAPALGKPVLVLREKTERQEAVKAGTVKLIGLNKDRLIIEFVNLMEDRNIYKNFQSSINPYGDGTTSKQIVDFIKKVFVTV